MLRNRAIIDADKAQISAAIAADADHSTKCDVDFWMPKVGDGSSLHYAVEDEQGAIMYVRLEKVLRVHVQFVPTEKRRIAKALDQFLAWITSDARRNHYKQCIFQSVVDRLIKFTYRRGWRKAEDEHVIDL